MHGRNAGRWLVRILAVLGTLIVALVAVLALIDANHFRGPLARYFARHTGREIRIDGALTTHLLSFTPRVVAEGVAIGNPPWMPPGPTAEIGRLSLSVELLPLFTHSFVIERLDLEGVNLHLARAQDGRANWQAHDPKERIGEGPPLIHSLSMPKAHVVLEDERRHLKFDGIVSAQDLPAAAGREPLRIDGAGNLNGHAVKFGIDGDPLLTVKRGQPYHFAYDESSSGSHLRGHGTLPKPFDFHSLETVFDAQGEDLKDLYFLTGISLPNTGAYKLSGNLKREGIHFQFGDLLATSGKSDMRGTFGVDVSSGRSKLEVDLHSQLLRLVDLGERAAGREDMTIPKTHMLSDTAIRVAGLRRNEAAVQFHAHDLEVGPTTLHDVTAQMAIDHGVVTITPFTAALPKGRISGRIKFDASRDIPAADADVRVTDVRLDQFDRKGKGDAPIDGVLQARLNVSGHGRSMHEIGSTANGTVTAVLPHGAIRASFAELTGIDVSRALGLMLTKNHKDTAVRCGVASFKIHDGTVTEDNLVIDTDAVLITGKGNVQLGSETVDFSIRGQPKTWRLVRLRSPVLVHGTLLHPSVGLDVKNSAIQTGEAVALGVLLTPLAAVLAFVDPGLAKDADCAALLAEAKSVDAHAGRAPAAH